jgi:putative ABC transport system permease protein
VAVSSDAAFELGLGLGDPVDVRADGTEHRLHVVAVFHRGLGVGGYLAGPATARLLGTTPAGTTTLVDASGPVGTTAAGLRARGLTVSTAAEYVDSATSADAATQHLSTVLLLLLLVFVVLGAATALVLTTAGRRAELVLLNRTGTTRRQLLRMTLVESLLTGGLAWAVGTVAVGPAVLGVSLGLLGPHVPVVDLATYAVLTSVVVVTAVIGTVAPAVLVLRRAGRVG